MKQLTLSLQMYAEKNGGILPETLTQSSLAASPHLCRQNTLSEPIYLGAGLNEAKLTPAQRAQFPAVLCDHGYGKIMVGFMDGTVKSFTLPTAKDYRKFFEAHQVLGVDGKLLASYQNLSDATRQKILLLIH